MQPETGGVLYQVVLDRNIHQDRLAIHVGACLKLLRFPDIFVHATYAARGPGTLVRRRKSDTIALSVFYDRFEPATEPTFPF